MVWCLDAIFQDQISIQSKGKDSLFLDRATNVGLHCFGGIRNVRAMNEIMIPCEM